jgi:coenzyme F420 hydrogenase subunit beta
MSERDIDFVTQNNLCFSCGACSVTCPVGAIGFEISNAGRLLPFISSEGCIKCGVCYGVCPGYDAGKLLFNDSQLDPFVGPAIGSYLGRSLNESVFRNAQSGGMVTEVLSFLFQQNRIESALVVTSAFSRKPVPLASFVTKSDQLSRSQKSVYTPISLLSALKDIGRIGAPIAVVGLPCHLQGVVALARHNSAIGSRIRYKLGLICGGVMSNAANDFFSNGIDEEHRIIFKNKQVPDFLHANVTLEYKKGMRKVVDRGVRFLLKEIITPPRCLLCVDKMNVYADIAFGDPWGIEGYDCTQGDSIVVTRNGLGHEVINDLIDSTRVRLRKIGYEDILSGQEVEKRKRIVYEAYEAYRRLGFETPLYFGLLKPSMKVVSDGRTKKRIETFLQLEGRSRYKVLKFITRKVTIALQKQRMKGVIKKMPLFRELRKLWS